MPSLNTPERIEALLVSKINKTPTCWLWTGRHTKAGYGQIMSNYRVGYVHRMMWERTHGAIPEGLQVLHKCDVPACVNPDHLFLGTQVDNMHDMLAKGRNDFIGTHRVGEGHPKSTVTNNMVRWIKYLRSLGGKHQRISEIVGTSRRNVCTILSGATWSHVKIAEV